MCQRAAELGHSLLFPAICRYCGEQIYLFATPEGGFAIFDDVGGDWPKHECWGVDQTTIRYTDPRPTYSRRFTFPVPLAASIVIPSPGARLVGTIVAQESPPGGGLWSSSLFDGRAIYRLATDRRDLLGRCVRGTVQVRGATFVLASVEILTPDPRLVGAPAGRARPAPTEVKTFQPSDIWSLQEQAQALQNTHPTTAATLSMALDALLNGYSHWQVRSCSRESSATHAEQVAAKLKATALRVVLLVIRDLGLHAVLPAIEARLSGGTLVAMDEETRRLLTEIRSLGELHRHFVPQKKIRETYERRLAKERRYLEKTHPGSDVSQDFDMLWQT
jgi:hypothetical protein